MEEPSQYLITRVRPKRADSCLWQVSYQQDNVDEPLMLVLLDTVAYHFGIQKGKVISPEDFEEMMQENDKALCYYEGMKIVHRGMYCTQDVEMKLKQRQFTKKSIAEAIVQLKKNHYLDDENYTQVFIENRIERESKRRIEERLRAKGISREMVEQAFATLMSDKGCDAESEIAKAIQVLNRKSPPVLSNLDREAQHKMRQKYLGSLMRKGFNFETSKCALQEWLDSLTQAD